MSLTVSIARRDVYTTAGTFDTSLYEIQADSDGEIIRDLELEGAEELLILRDALSEYIKRNNIISSEHNSAQQ